MGWIYYDIKDHVHHMEGLKREFEHNYWNVNLMCHLLREYPYRHLIRARVHAAMERFKARVSRIDDEKVFVYQKELESTTKAALMAEFQAVADEFRNNHPLARMRDLYTTDLGLGPVLTHFHRMQELIAADTQQQTDPADPTRLRFTGPCGMCIPFLEIQEGVIPPVPVAEIEEFLRQFGECDLADLFRTPARVLSPDQVKALRTCRTNGLLDSRELVHNVIGFKNDMKCVAGACQTFVGALCMAAPDNSCSAMSPPEGVYAQPLDRVLREELPV